MKQAKLFLLTVLVLAMFNAFAQTKIGDPTTTMDPSSLLELEHPNKALYLTRISLTSTIDLVTVPSPKAGMIVYNSNAAITATIANPKLGGGIGVYYFNGTRWAGVGDGAGNGDYWRIAGNSATVNGSNFQGNIDNVPLNFRVNNQKAGRIGSSPFGFVSLGYQAGKLAEYNTVFIGYQAGLVTQGERNYFVGYQAGYISTNSQVHYDGYRAGYNSNSQNQQTFSGYKAGYSNGGGSNTATGYRALELSPSGDQNNVFGSYALQNNNGGSWNNAFGTRAMYLLTEKGENVAVGHQALLKSILGSISGGENTVLGSLAMQQNSSATENSAYGYKAMYNNIDGTRNTAVGQLASFSNTIGNDNVVVGYQAGYNNIVSENQFVGYKAGYSNVDGTPNVFIGYQNGYSNTSGAHNTATGYNAFYSNITGSYNTAYGSNALNGSSSANNAAFGYKALYGLSSGTDNTALGINAGDNITTGSNNIVIGAGAQASAAAVSNEITIGNVSHTIFRTYGNLFPASDNANTLGTSTNRWTVVYAVNGPINTSDARMKKNVRNLNYGLDAILKMRPVLYDWKNNTGNDKIGFIAQELRNVVPNVVVGNESKQTLGVMYSDLVPVLTKAIQEQQTQMEALKKDKHAQATTISLLTEEIALLRAKSAAFNDVAMRIQLLEKTADNKKIAAKTANK